MRRVRRKGGNKEKVFGCDLMDHLTASCQEIPQVLRSCSEFVERNGIVDGIYRLSGVSSNIQKLRGEFENDGGPDLNKDVYLQDIHCVSSLCKAYFRELPNPLLTYQLYDKFAEAVAIQLEEERLVKIRDVLKELPTPHYRTLEFLMRHLVRMASFSSETNMHARNLAIVWAPNLLRSKDIETSGFNGTAAFMEVRVQSIVVEFILTHVPQLFPQQGVSHERRTSLPSPSATPLREESLFKPLSNQPVTHFGNLSPGDGPLPIRPYHAIIEGTDKRKGSLRGKKWTSIFNIGGRFHDQRRRHKHSGKEKEKPVLRPARSMDSLSTQPYPKEGSKPPALRPPSTHLSAVATPTPQSDVAVSAGALGGSEYAVTYRRGTGVVVGGGGTQGTYTALDPEGSAGNETVQSRSPGQSTKVGRRAAMHITGPTIVSVPLHITSNLALGVLKGGGGDRVIHRSRDKEGVEMRKGGEKTEKEQIKEIQKKVEVSTKAEEKTDSDEEKNRREVVALESNTKTPDDTDKKDVVTDEEEDKESKRNSKQESMATFQSESTEQREESLSSNSEDEFESDYTVMKKGELDGSQNQGDSLLKATDVIISTKAEEDDQELSGYVQDNFEFLDQMDCSVLEHMDCSVSYQVNEFSVEPPGHSDDEYEMMHPFFNQPTENQTNLQRSPETHNQSQTQPKPHRPLSLDLHSRHTKSLSLPHMVSPSHGPEESGSEEDSVNDDSDDILSSFEEDDSMFVKSLPSDFFLSSLSGLEAPDAKTEDGPDEGPAHDPHRSDEAQSQSPNIELPVCIESDTGEKECNDGLKEQAIAKMEEDDQVPHRQEVTDNITQSESKEDEKLLTTDAGSEEAQSADFTPCCGEFPQLIGEDSDVETLHQGSTHVVEKDTLDAVLENSRRLSVTSAEHPIDIRGDPSDGDSDEREDTRQQFAMASDKNNKNMHDKPIRRVSEGFTDELHECSKEWDSAMGVDIWDEIENVVIEVIENEERKQLMRRDAAGAAEVEYDDEAEGSVQIMPEEPDNEVEVKEESLQVKGKENTEPVVQEDFADDETYLPKICEFEKVIQSKPAIHKDTQNHSGAEVAKQSGKESYEHPVTSGLGKQLKEVSESTESRKCAPSVEGVSRKLVVSKQPRVYQVKAVPVVPPKPHHCKITALTLRQQQREREDAGRSNESTGEVLANRNVVCIDQENVDENGEMKNRLEFRGGDKERDRRRDRPDSAVKDMSRNSPLSMCFDEAVAIATMRREKEKREGEAEAEGLGK